MRRERVLILGAGGQGLATLDILMTLPNFQVIGFLDSNPDLHHTTVGGYTVFGGPETLICQAEEKQLHGVFVAIGDNSARRQLAAFVRSLGLSTPPCVHPSAQIAPLAALGQGTFVAHNVVIGPGVAVQDDVIVNTASVISHRCHLGPGVNIAPGVKLAGSVTVGAGAFVGIGATVIQGRSVGASSTIGAGAVVTRDIPPNVVAVGVPARVVRRLPAEAEAEVAAGLQSS